MSERAGTFSSERINTNFQWKSEVVGTPSDLLNGSEWDNLSQQVWDTFQCHQQTDKTFVKKMKLKDKIFKVIRVSRIIWLLLHHQFFVFFIGFHYIST